MGKGWEIIESCCESFIALWGGGTPRLSAQSWAQSHVCVVLGRAQEVGLDFGCDMLMLIIVQHGQAFPQNLLSTGSSIFNWAVTV